MANGTGDAEMFMRPREVMVRSHSDPGKVYQVQLPWCPCTGFHFRGVCSHILTAITEYSAGEHTEAVRIAKKDGPRAVEQLLAAVEGMDQDDLAAMVAALRDARATVEAAKATA